jgi:Leucine-rich repeat (LRR) protein
VIKISLGGCGLKGVFPVPSIFTFKYLQWVQMPASQYPYSADNRSLAGPLPKDLAFSTSLQRLELYGNALSGSLHVLANLTGLISLDLHFNYFTGPLPDLHKSSATLEYVSFANNGLTGTIPASYGTLRNLDTFGLASNKLSGTRSQQGNSICRKATVSQILPTSPISGWLQIAL